MIKKFLSMVLCALMLLASITVSACQQPPEDPTEGNPFSGEVVELVKNQAHEEKSGYTFCGYFQDENFTERVWETFETVPTGYYAKYQLDKSQLINVYNDLKFKPLELEQVIYATDYQDAVFKFDYCTYTEEMKTSYSMELTQLEPKKLGESYTLTEYIIGCEDKNRFYDFHYNVDIPFKLVDNNIGGYYNVYVKRNTKWRAYIGEPIITEEGFEYYIVDGKYAVIVGANIKKSYETLNIPSEIDGKPVKVISVANVYIEEDFTIGTLNVPSSVECFMLYRTPQNFINKIVFSEGVKTIQMATHQTEELVIPSTAHYVDLQNSIVGVLTEENRYLRNQNITVSEDSPHYYTKDGFLYTTEGDAVYQFGNREKLTITFDSKAKHVMPRSVNGIAKNIIIPENIEEFDLFFNQYSLRHIACMQNERYRQVMPVFIINSKKVAEKVLNLYVQNSIILGTYMSDESKHFISPLIAGLYDLITCGADTGWQQILESAIRNTFTQVNEEQINALLQNINMLSPLKIEGNLVYTTFYDIITGEWSDLTVCSYLDGNYPQEYLAIDSALRSYLDNV